MRHAMGLGAATPAHRGAMLWLVTWHCHLPLLAAQMTTSGAEDAAVLLEAKAAADTSACTCTNLWCGRLVRAHIRQIYTRHTHR